MNRHIEVETDHYRVEDHRAKAVWDRNIPREDAYWRQLVHGWVFLDHEDKWVAMDQEAECDWFDDKETALAHFDA